MTIPPKRWCVYTKLHDVISHKAVQWVLIYIPNIPFHDLELKILKSAFLIYRVPDVFHVLL